MDPEQKRLLEETHALARDNHRMLRSVRRHQIITDFGKFIIWLILIGAVAYSYQIYLKPIADKFQITGTLGLPTSADMQKLIDSYKAGK